MDINQVISYDMLIEIYNNSGSFTKAKMSLLDKRFRHLSMSPIGNETYEYICWLISNENQLSGVEVIKALNTLSPYRDELGDTIKKYTKQAANLISGMTPQQIKDEFGIKG
jgi:hypothetical protein